MHGNVAKRIQTKYSKKLQIKISNLLQILLFLYFDTLPSHRVAINKFARYLANGVTSYGTVTGYISTIKKIHELGGFPYPRNMPRLQHERAALKIELAHLIKKAPPITPQMLMKIYQHVNLKDEVDIVAFAALVIGFVLFLRKSNLVPDTLGGFREKEQLTGDDVLCDDGHVMVDIKWSKTMQARDKELRLLLIPAKNKVVCAVFWSTHLVRRDPGRPGNTPLFACKVNGRLMPLTYDVLASKLKTWVSLTGACGDTYTLHGLRRGSCNQAMTMGICGEDLKLMGGGAVWGIWSTSISLWRGACLIWSSLSMKLTKRWTAFAGSMCT